MDLIVWVDNSRVRRDSTVTFGPADCDVVVPNHASGKKVKPMQMRSSDLWQEVALEFNALLSYVEELKQQAERRDDAGDREEFEILAIR